MSAPAPPTTLPVKGLDGAEQGEASLALRVAGPKTAKGLVHRYLLYVQQNARRGTASTLTRGEVSGGGRKPYAQKKLGGARRGSQRTPLRPGGGVSFGPKPKDWSIKMNRKERRLALATALQSASADMTVVESLADKLETGKTRSLVAALEGLGVPAGSKALLILSAPHEKILQAGRNVDRLAINSASCVNIFDVLNADRIVIEQPAVQWLQDYYGGAEEEEEEVAAPAAP